MPVEVIENREIFNSMREQWNSVYRVDNEAQWFLSWQWLSQLYARRDEPLRILIYRPHSSERSPVAFFPIRQQIHLSKRRVDITTVYRLPGNYWADYTGLLCNPEYEQSAIPAFSAYMATQPWGQLYLENIKISEQRLELLLRYFQTPDFSVRRKKFGEGTAGPDLSISPHIILPSTFESYLKQHLSANSRQRIRRFRRKLASDSTLDIRQCCADTLDNDLNNFERLWSERWAEEKGEKVKKLATRYSLILRQGLISGDMQMLVMTHREHPIGMVACYMDNTKRSMLFFVAARNVAFKQLPIGLLLHTRSIEMAIERGYQCYDFLRGDEPYKYSLGASNQIVKSVIISSHRHEMNLDIRLESSVNEIFAKLVRYQRSAKLADIDKIHAKLLKLQPKNALFRKRIDAWNESSQ